MKIQVVKVGRPAHPAYAELVQIYIKRLRSVWKIEDLIIKAQGHEERSGKDLFQRLGWNSQGVKLDPGHKVIVLDERGRSLSSPQLAQQIAHYIELSPCKTLSVVIGGPFGLTEEVLKRADLVWSLSPAVFPSDLAWLMVWEQLYRASTMIRGTGYHHE